MIDAAELLQRIAATIKGDIAPAVSDEYTRTQGFMASVIIERIAKQIALAPNHAEAESTDLADLFGELAVLLIDAPPPVTNAVRAAVRASSVAALGPLIEALYGWEGEASASALAAVRVALRNDIDRRMEIAL